MTDNTGNTTTSGATRKPAARSSRSSRTRPSRAKSAGVGSNSAQRAGAAIANPASTEDWRGLDRMVSRYLAGHPGASIGETTIGELLAWAQQRRPKTMTAGAGA